MGYLKEPFVLTLAPGDKHSVHHSFFATLFEKREIVPTDQMSWATVAQHTFQKAVERGGKLEAASLLIDARGGALLVDFRGNLSTSNATSALAKVLEDFPPEQRSLALETLFPVDELTKERIEGMLTVAACEPPPFEQEAPQRPSCSDWATSTRGMSLAEKLSAFGFFAEDSDEPPAEQALVPLTSPVPIQSSAIEWQTKTQAATVSARTTLSWAHMVTLLLRNVYHRDHTVLLDPRYRREVPAAENLHHMWHHINNMQELEWAFENLELQVQHETEHAKTNTQRYKLWAEHVNANATVVVASFGVHSCTYERCYKPARCELLLATRLTSSATLLQVARTAWNMAVLGQLKTPTTQKQKLDFGKMCSKVVAGLNPKTPNSPKDLTDSERARFYAILNGDTTPQEDDDPFEGCFNCLDDEPEWVTTEILSTKIDGKVGFMSRCAKCKYPKAFGRSIKGLGDFFPSSLKRQRGLEARNHRKYFGL